MSVFQMLSYIIPLLLHQVEELVKSKGVEILVIDAHFPDGNSPHIIPQLKDENPDLRVLIFSGLEENLHAIKFIHAGANGYLSKLSEEEEVEQAIRSIVQKGESTSRKLFEIYWSSMPITLDQ